MFTIVISKQELDTIVGLLGIGRYVDVAGLLQNIQQQVNKQLTPPAAEAPAPRQKTPPVELPRPDNASPAQ